MTSNLSSRTTKPGPGLTVGRAKSELCLTAMAIVIAYKLDTSPNVVCFRSQALLHCARLDPSRNLTAVYCGLASSDTSRMSRCAHDVSSSRNSYLRFVVLAVSLIPYARSFCLFKRRIAEVRRGLLVSSGSCCASAFDLLTLDRPEMRRTFC